MIRKPSLRQALTAVVGGVVVLGLVPAGIALDRRLVADLERNARSDLAMAPRILADRDAMQSDALMMHAKDLAGTPGLAEAVAEGDRTRALAIARAASGAADERVVLVGPDGAAWSGPPPDPALLAETRRGAFPVSFRHRDGALYRMSLAPLLRGDEWWGAAGVATPLDESVAGTLAGLTRSAVVLVGPDRRLVAATVDSSLVKALLDSGPVREDDPSIREFTSPDGERYWAAFAPLGDVGTAAFVRSADEALAVLPGLRRSASLAVLLALVITLLLGSYLAGQMARPVQALAQASRRLADGDFQAPVPDSRLEEVDRVSRAFRAMRASLAETIGELREANEELEERQARLQALQAELIQRDRLAATGRLVTELAHEIRNPVAGVRNCLEIIRRRAGDDPELREFASMAIEELLRMHRLAEKMLDANRPLDPEAEACDATRVAEQVAELTRAARDAGGPSIDASGPEGLRVAMGPDSLKQVLLNLVENAREAMDGAKADAGGIEIRVREDPGDGGGVSIEVVDRGSGFEEEVRSRIFDPFFTTKDEVHGVGLGLFVVEGLLRRHGGRITAANRPGGGARIRIHLPRAGEAGPSPARAGTEEEKA